MEELYWSTFYQCPDESIQGPSLFAKNVGSWLVSKYSANDVNILEHANLVVFDNEKGEKCAIYIQRHEETDEFYVYGVKLFNKPSDSWINEDDLECLNSCSDTSCKFNEELSEHKQYQFTSDLCWYYGAINFDSTPYREHINLLEAYLQDNNLI